jgi:hypothetical protein
MVRRKAMKFKVINVVIILILALSSLFALEVNVPNEVPAYENLEVILTPKASEGTIREARFFFYQKGRRDPLYSEFVQERDSWVARIPYTYLIEEELSYFTVMQNTDGTYFRDPQIGTRKARLIQDTTPPRLSLLSPSAFSLVPQKEQLVVFAVEDESALTSFSITMDGQPITRSGVFGQYLSFLINPGTVQEAVITIEMSDRYENASTETFTFAVTSEKAPFFIADASYRAGIELEYILGMGKSNSTADIKTVLTDLDHQNRLSFELGGNALLKVGPVAVEALALLKDSLPIMEITEAYPNTLLADIQNFLNLYNPIDFTSEFDWTGEIAREYENENQFLLKISIFGPALTYQFGDQQISFQKETVRDMWIRGTAVAIDLPFFEFKVSKGLTDFGLYQVAWPQNFLGFKLGVKAKTAWYLQTNLSFISSLQGSYEELKGGATSNIADLYELGSIPPEQNMVLGLSTGLNNKHFVMDASFSFSMYNGDASTVMDVNQLANDLEGQGGPDLSTYLGYLDKVQNILPILNYFLPTNGLISGIINRNLWGISYGVDIKVPNLGLDAWVRKTDATYKSLGSSVATDEFTFGTAIEKSLGDFVFSGGYSYNQNNIADILFNDIVGLIKPSLAPASDPTADDISKISHTIQGGVDTPQHPLLGLVSVDYTFLLETSNAVTLADKQTDAAKKTAILDSSSNDVSLIHTGELRYRSGRYKFGNVTTNFGAKTKDSYVTRVKIDGADANTSFFEFSYALSSSINVSRYAISLGFDHAWSTEDGSVTAFGYDAKLSIKNTFFDTISITVGLDQAFKTSLDAWKIAGSFSLEKRIGMISTSASLDVSYYDSLLDNNDDALTATLTVKGVFRK